MPQQLSLYASIPDDDLNITLHTLVALTGMEPRTVFEQNLIWVPRNPFRPVLAAGQVNQIEQYRLRLACDLVSYTRNQRAISAVKNKQPEEDVSLNEQFKSLMVSGKLILSFNQDQERRKALQERDWLIHAAELPEAGKRKVISQALLSTQVTDGDPFEFLENLGYVFSSQYWIKGYQFTYGKIVIQLFRLCSEDEAQTGQLKLLDPSGHWSIKAYTNVQAITDIEALTSATQNLERLKAEVAGLFNLEQPDRNCFDPRIKKR